MELGRTCLPRTNVDVLNSDVLKVEIYLMMASERRVWGGLRVTGGMPFLREFDYSEFKFGWVLSLSPSQLTTWLCLCTCHDQPPQMGPPHHKPWSLDCNLKQTFSFPKRLTSDILVKVMKNRLIHTPNKKGARPTQVEKKQKPQTYLSL